MPPHQPQGIFARKYDRPEKKTPSGWWKFDAPRKHLQECTGVVSQEESPPSVVKDRLIAELHTAREEFKRAKTLLDAASAQGERDHPDRIGALTTATAEYDCALNQYQTAVNNFADYVLNHA
jgi:hypothetical protein